MATLGSSSEEQSYVAQYLLAKVRNLGDPHLWRAILEKIESEGFFARQAEILGGFEQTSADLEQVLLPHFVETGDWPRLIRHGQTAAILRGLAEALGEEIFVDALARAGRSDLADALIGQLPDPARRVRLRAVRMTALSRAGEMFGVQLDQVKSDLEAAAGRPPEDYCQALEGAARNLAVELQARWAEYAEDLPEGPLRNRLWRAVAAGFLERRQWDAPLLWQALSSIRDSAILHDLLAGKRVPALRHDGREAWRMVARLHERLPALRGEHCWRLALPLVAQCREAPRQILHRLTTVLGPAPWTVPLIEAGAELWARFPAEERPSIESRIANSSRNTEVVLAFKVVVLEAGEPHVRDLANTWRALAALEDGARQLHWALRLLEVVVGSWGQEAAGRLASLGRHLERVRFQAPREDLLRYLELVAETSRETLRWRVEDVLWAPGSDPETLRFLVQGAREKRLIHELFERAEEYAALVAPTSAEGFELRREVLVLLASRICQREHSVQPFEAARQRLLPEEEDELRREVARSLALAGCTPAAMQVAEAMGSARARFRTLLQVLPEEAVEDRRRLLTPEALYRAVADTSPLTDELRAVAVLLEEPAEPEKLARTHLEGIDRPSSRIEALVDLAHHALAWQESQFQEPLRDRLAAVLPLKQALGVVESDLWLAYLTPDLVQVGARLGPRMAVAEVQEAWERVSGLEDVGWSVREEVLGNLLAQVRQWIAPDPHEPSWRRLLEWLAGSPSTMVDGEGRRFLRRHWQRIFPWLAALEALVVRPWWSRPWQRKGIEPWLRRWSWLDSAQTPALQACFLSMEDRRRRGEEGSREARSGDMEDDEVRAVIVRSVVDLPQRVPGWLAGLPPGPEREDLVLRLLGGGWLPRTEAEALMDLFPADGPIRHRARVRSELRNSGTPETREPGPSEGWLHALAELGAAGALGGPSPRLAPVRRRLRERLPETALQRLAAAVPEALAAGGRQAGEDALRLFVNAWLEVRPGRAAVPRVGMRHKAALQAVRRARSLTGDGPEVSREAEVGPDDATDTEEEAEDEADRSEIQRLDGIFRRWRKSGQGDNYLWTQSPQVNGSGLTLLIALSTGTLLGQLDSLLFFGAPEPRWLAGVPAGWFFGGLAGVLVVRGVVLTFTLAAGTGLERRLPSWLAVLSIAMASLPLLGLLVIPVRQWLERRRPEWLMALRIRLPVRHLAARHRLKDRFGTVLLRVGRGFRHALFRLGRRVPTPLGLVVLFILDTLWLHLVVGWLLPRSATDSRLTGILLLFGALAHLGAFACVYRFLSWRAHELRWPSWSAALFPYLALFWLPPLPALWLLGMLIWLFVEGFIKPERKTLVSSTFSSAASRLPTWRTLRLGLQTGWRRLPWRRRLLGRQTTLDPVALTDDEDRHIRRFYQLQVGALFFEAAALAWLLEKVDILLPLLGWRWLDQGWSLVRTTVQALVLLGVPLLVVGLAVQLYSFLCRLLRKPWKPGGVPGWKLAQFLVVSATAWVAGYFFGFSLASSDAAELSGLLVLLGLGICLLQVAPQMLSIVLTLEEPRPWADEGMWWTLGGIFMAIVGLGMTDENASVPAGFWMALFEALLWYLPVVGFILSFGTLSWFLRPVQPRWLLDDDLPPTQHRRLLFLAFTALIPLGGLFVPLWIWLRPRWWPGFRELARSRR